MAAIGNFNFALIIELGAHIIIFISRNCEAIEHVQRANSACGGLDFANLRANQAAQLVKKIVFQALDFFLGAQNFIFVFLELRHDKALGVHQRLLAHKVIGHAISLSLGDLNIIAKDLVKAHLHRFDASGFLNLELKILHPGLIIGRNQLQLVQLRVIAGSNHATLAHREGRFIHDSLL